MIFLYLRLCYYGFVNSSSCESAPPALPGYDLEKPDLQLTLPDTLREVSGLVVLDANTIACVQDENGILFVYDLKKNKIKYQYAFHVNGDYEGLALVDKTIYVLRSDGMIFQIDDHAAKKKYSNSYKTGVPATNNEGLCYDQKHNRLLVGCKSSHGKGPAFKDKRAIYSFDLKTKKLSEKPIYEIDLALIRKFAEEKGIQFPVRLKKGGEKVVVLRFRISALGIHPVTGKLFVLSALDHSIFVFDEKGQIEHIERLNREMFNKAEGIAFLPNGDMLITNEGQNKKPTLLRFKYVK